MNPTPDSDTPRKASGSRPADGLPAVSVVVPTYCERENVRPLVEELDLHLGHAELGYEVVFVDDDSPDGTADAVREVGALFPARVIERKDERGLATAVIRGVAECRAPVVVVMDGDLSHPPGRIVGMVQPVLEDEADMTLGSRYVPGGETDDWPWYRELISRIAIGMAAPLVPVRDLTSGYLCIRKELLAGVELNPLGYKIALEILVKARPERVREVPIRFRDRHKGRSKFSITELVLYLGHLGRLYPIRFPWLRQAGRALQILLVILLATGVVAYGARKVDDMNGPEPGQPASAHDYNDFNVFFGAGQGLLEGKDIYREPTSPENRYFLFPPAFALYMSAVSRLGLRGAAAYWFVANVSMVIVSAWLIAGILARDRFRRILLALVGALLTLRFIDSDLGNGNVNSHVLFFLALGLWLLSRRRGFLAGMSIGLAALTKLTPMIFLGYFLWKAGLSALRRLGAGGRLPAHDATVSDAGSPPGRSPVGSVDKSSPPRFWGSAAGGMITALVLFTLVVPPLVLGWNRSRELHVAFYDSMVAPYAQVKDYPEKYWADGYSLKVVLVHYLTDQTLVRYRDRPVHVNFARWSPRHVWWLYVGLSLGMVVLSLTAWRRHLVDGSPAQWGPFILALEIGTVAALMVSISPMTRKAHFVVLLIPAIAALSAGFRTRATGSRPVRAVLVCAALSIGLIGLGSSGDLVGAWFHRVLDAHTVLFWAGFLTWVACIYALLRLGRGGRPSVSPGA